MCSEKPTHSTQHVQQYIAKLCVNMYGSCNDNFILSDRSTTILLTVLLAIYPTSRFAEPRTRIHVLLCNAHLIRITIGVYNHDEFGLRVTETHAYDLCIQKATLVSIWSGYAMCNRELTTDLGRVRANLTDTKFEILGYGDRV